MTKRIWELDALRGICILGMVLVHIVYDFGSPALQAFPLYRLALRWGGICFLLLSGISVTLGSHWCRRGCIVFACGLLCTAATAAVALAGSAGQDAVIYFGILHCLGICMLLWPLFKKLPSPVLLLLGLVMAIGGLYLKNHVRVDFPWLIPFGVLAPGFVSSDYFPLLPNLGYFLVGALLGRTLYRRKETLLPKVNSQWAGIRFLCLCGKHSLWIYLLHQPILTGILYIVRLF